MNAIYGVLAGIGLMTVVLGTLMYTRPCPAEYVCVDKDRIVAGLK